MTKTLFRLCAAVLLTASFAFTPAFGQKAADSYGKLPLSFEANRGQTDASVQFFSRGSGYAVFLEPSAATLVLNKSVAPGLKDEQGLTKSEAVRLDLAGANRNAVMSGEQTLPGYVTYMTGTDQSKWQVGLPTYAATRVKDVYPGISLVYYGKGRELEYDFVVAPGANADEVKLTLHGAKPILESGGDLRLQVGAEPQASDVVFRKPALYQQIDGKQVPVDGAYRVAVNGDVSFTVGGYDHSRELVIDPVISYATYYGGGIQDNINGSTINAANQLYAVGHTYSANLPKTTGELDTTNPNNAANSGGLGFVTKFSADGSSVLWSTFIGGPANGTNVNAVAVNSSDQAIIVGSTGGVTITQNGLTYTNYPLFPITSDAYQSMCGPNGNGAYGNPTTGETSACGTDAFIARLSSDGKTLLYSTFLGGSQDDIAVGVALDASANIYVTGITHSTGYTYAVSSNQTDVPSYPVNNHGQASYGVANFPVTANAYQNSTAESKKYATTDGSGNVFGPSDWLAFLSVLSADGHSLMYSTLLGGGNLGGCGNGACMTNVTAIAVSPQGYTYIAGNTSSSAWPITANAFSSVCGGNTTGVCPPTGWLAGFNLSSFTSPSLLFSTYMTGSSGGTDSNNNNIVPPSSVNAVTTDTAGNVYATGYTYANNFPSTAGVLQATCALGYGDGNGDHNTCNSAFVTKLTFSGSTIWSTYYRGLSLGSPVVNASGIAVDASNDVYVVGTSYEPSVPLKNSIAAPTSGADALLFELSPDATKLLVGTYLGSVGGVTVTNNSLKLDSQLNAYFTGTQTFQNNAVVTFPTTPGAFSQSGFGNSTVSWAVKLITQQQTSSTALQITPTSASPGASIGFMATITGVSGLAVPTGTVTLSNGSNTLGTITLANGTGTFSTTGLAAGTYSVVATYSGDVVYAASATTAQSVTIQNTPAITLTATPSTATIGTSIALKATLTSTAGTPTGTVYFLDGTNMLGSSTLSGGLANYTATALAVGPHSITARYSGDSSFVGLISTAQTVTINLITPSVSLTATPSNANIGTTIALSTTVSGTGATPTGTVKFLDGTTVLNTFTLTGTSGVATYPAAGLASGAHSITAVYSGDANFSSITSAAQTVTINLLTPAIALTATPSTAQIGTAIALGATVTGTGATPTGTVKFLDGSTLLSTFSLAGTSGVATYSATALAVGTHSITAVYSGDTNFSSITSAVQTVTITAIPQTVTLAAAPSSLTIIKGATGTTVITVTPGGGYTGTLTFACGTLPTAASCSFAPSTLTFTGGATAQSSTLTIATASTHAALDLPLDRRVPMVAFAGLLLLPLASRRRKLKGILPLLIILGSLATLAFSGCGSSPTSTTTDTPTGSYTIPVTVTGATATNTLNLQVAVQ